MIDPNLDSGIDVKGAPQEQLADWYHRFVRMPWPWVVGGLAIVFLVANLTFGTAYWLTGGVANATSFTDCFFFSVQTLATIGYGVMAPSAAGSHALVTLEAFVGLLLTAIVTGLVFTRASLPRARVRFASRVCIAPVNGVPHLMVRAGNLRAVDIIEATIHVTLVRTEKTAEGVTLYRQLELPLVRQRAPSFAGAWLGLHVIDEHSPLHGSSPESLVREEVELRISIVGIDGATSQTVHAQVRYETADFVFGARHADLLSEQPSGRLALDLTRFDDVAPA
ncbi:MAG: ion channel [Myxococcales bacterium]|nr:ion channel [Myxococcales bacterium]